MMSKYVTVRMTALQAYAVADAAAIELESRRSDNANYGDERLVVKGMESLLNAWRRAGAPLQKLRTVANGTAEQARPVA